MTYKIHCLEKEDKDLISLWDSLVIEKNLAPQASYAWKEHLNTIFDVTAFALLAVNHEGKAKGISLVYFKHGDDVLYSCRYGFYAFNKDVTEALQKKIMQICQDANIRKTHITSGSIDVGLQERISVQNSLYLPLEYSDQESLWLSIPKKTKNMIRKAEKSGFTISSDWKHLEEFYGIYADRFLQKSLNLKPLIHFHSIRDIFGKNALFIGAFRDQKLVAGMLFISTGKIVSYAYNASIVNALNNGTNNLLMWEAMKIFHKKGAQYIDLSESKPDSAVFKFKSRLSKDIEPREIYYYNILENQNTRHKFYVKFFLQQKIYGILHRLMPVMPQSIKRHYLIYKGKRGRVI